MCDPAARRPADRPIRALLTLEQWTQAHSACRGLFLDLSAVYRCPLTFWMEQ